MKLLQLVTPSQEHREDDAYMPVSAQVTFSILTTLRTQNPKWSCQSELGRSTLLNLIKTITHRNAHKST